MLSREELLKSPEYWFEIIQNDLYRKLDEYLQNEGLTQTEFAQKLGVSKGYISQIMNGNFNYTLKKLIELSLAINKIPEIGFTSIDDVIEDDKRKIDMLYSNSKFTALSDSGKQLHLKRGNATFVFEGFVNVGSKKDEIAA